MAKLKSLLLILCCFAAWSCKEKIVRNFVRNDDMVSYKNYADTTIIVHSKSLDIACPMTDSVFAINDPFWQERPLWEITDAAEFEFFTQMIKGAIVGHEQKVFGEDGLDSYSFFSELYLCGVMKPQPGVQSLVLVMSEPSQYNQMLNTRNYIVLCNVHDGVLTSVVVLSDMLAKKSYWMGGYFSQVREQDDFIENYIPLYVLNEKPTPSTNLETLEYSLFIIDECGFVKFIYI